MQVRTMFTNAWVRGIVVFFGALAVSLIAGFTAWNLGGWLAGPNVSDVGVRMYTRCGLAIAGALVTYIVLVMGALVFVSRALRESKGLVWAIGSAVATPLFLGLVLLLWFTYG